MSNRFESIKKEIVSFEGYNMFVYVLRDTQTGVMYLAEQSGNSGGWTPLIDKDGKPLTTFKVNI